MLCPPTDLRFTLIGPIVSELEKDGSATFFFLQGSVEQPISKEIEGLYDGPYYGYFNCDYAMDGEGLDSIKEAIRNGTFQKSVSEAYTLLYDVLQEEGPFDGVIGFSHGATLAFAFLLQHAQNNPLEPPYALFRCAVFIFSLAPLGEDGVRLKYNNSVGPLLKIPTLHITGKVDAMYSESLNMYKLCDDHTAKLVRHDSGHWIPRDRKTIMVLAKAIEDLVSRSTII